MFVVLEGIDGSGKTTLVQQLKRYNSFPAGVVFTREPGGTPTGEQIRKVVLEKKVDPKSTFLLMQAARIEHMHEVILPALLQGKIVICDRYYGSSLVYQGEQGVPIDFMDSVLSQTDTIVPDACIYLDVPTSIAKVRNKNVNFFDAQVSLFFDNLKKHYEHFLPNLAFRSYKVDTKNASPRRIGDKVVSIINEYDRNKKYEPILYKAKMLARNGGNVTHVQL